MSVRGANDPWSLFNQFGTESKSMPWDHSGRVGQYLFDVGIIKSAVKPLPLGMESVKLHKKGENVNGS